MANRVSPPTLRQPKSPSWLELRKHLRVQLAVWPLIALALLATIWLTTEKKIATDKHIAEAAAFREATVLADSYADQLLHMAEQIDQITLRIAYDWMNPKVHLDLKQDRLRGLFPRRSETFAFIVDPSGNVVETSFSAVSVASRSQLDYFIAHKNQCCSGLLVTKPSFSAITGTEVIRFTRALSKPGGSFGGVVVFAVEPDFLATFQSEGLRGKHDFVSVRLNDGPLLATRLGMGSKKQTFYRKDPLFPSPRGRLLEPGEIFFDGRPRFVAWRKLDNYPLVALSGLTVEEALAAFHASAYRMRFEALMVSALIFCGAGAATVFSAKHASRRRRDDEVRETYRMATDAANEGFFMLRPLTEKDGTVSDFLLEDCNNRAGELLGTRRELIIGRKVSALSVGMHRDSLVTVCQKTLDRGLYEDEFRVPSQSALRVQWVYRRAVHSGTGIALTLRDISEAKAQQQVLSDMANHDSLTSLFNRLWLGKYLPEAIAHAALARGTLAVLFIDLDNFKVINDTLGHEAGDELLIQAAHRIVSAVRSSDHVIRLGGDEFTVILEQLGAPEDAGRVADVIIKRLTEAFVLKAGSGNKINASIGISVFPHDGVDADSLLKHADVAMYAAKAGGKGRHHFYHSQLSDALLLRLNKERALRDAVDADEFVLHYQPRVHADTGQLCSMEALVRWQHPERGLVYPSEFIDLAEDVGLIVPIGELVIDKVCAQLARWRAMGMVLLPVSINISPYQLKHGKVAEHLGKAIETYQIDQGLIEVELTESAVIDRGVTVSNELRSLRGLGVRLMIDDFGTGYSSLAQLYRLDVDVLKVDKAFTQALSEGSEGELIYRAIISMARALGMRVVAEGVETLAQFKQLQAMECDEIQGFIVSRAVPPEAVPALVRLAILPPFMSSGCLAETCQA